jgi:hypothetical protein
MAIAIEPFDPRYNDAIVDFNRRMAAGGSSYQFPERFEPSEAARGSGSAMAQEFFLAVDGEVVRGGYALQRRGASFGNEECQIGSWYQPVSEGSVDPKHALVAIQLLRDAFRREPLSFGLGMEGPGSQLSKLTASLRCEHRLIPFFVRIQNGRRFAQQARYLRRRRALAPLLDVAAATGAAGLGAALLRGALQRVPRLGADLAVERVTEFGPWADEVWSRCHSRYSFVQLRDTATLNRLYSSERQRFRCVRLARESATVGWAVLDVKQMSDDSKFGDLKVGRLADCFAAPEDAELVVRAAVDALADAGVDVVLSNQSHPAWCAALRRNAFLAAPSNFLFAPSPELGKKIRAIDPEGHDVYLTRADAHGGSLVRAPFSARRARMRAARGREARA